MKSNIGYRLKRQLFHRIFKRGKMYRHEEKFYSEMVSTFTEDREIAISYRLCAARESKNRIVILAHPYLAEAKTFFLKQNHVHEYLKAGYDVVIFDFNGFGLSPFRDFDFYKDIQTVFEWAMVRWPNKKMTIHGISFGASQIIRAVSRNMLEKSDIVIENCLDKSLNYFKVRNLRLYYFLKFFYFFNPEAKKDADFVHKIRFIANINRMSFIYNKEDTLTTLEMGRKLMEAARFPYEYLECPGEHLKAIEDTSNYMNFLVNHR